MKIDIVPQPDSTPVEKSVLPGLLQKHWIRCAFLAVLGFIVRLPALQGQLIWDDQYLARDNPFIKSPLLALEVFRHYLFLDSYSAHYRPVQNISMMFDYVLWNTNTFGFHLTNVLLHVGSGLLLYFLARNLFRSFEIDRAKARSFDGSDFALFVAAIWMVHPVHSAAVDYISGRADSLSFLFACGAWLLFLKARKVSALVPRVIVDLSAAGSALLALCSRESACLWFAIFLIHLLFFEHRFSRRLKTVVIICCAVVLASYLGLRQLPPQRATGGPVARWSAPVRTVLMLRALGDYGRLLIFPSNLHMERTVVNPAGFENESARRAWIQFEYLSILGLGVAAAIVALALRRGGGQRARVFGAIWFVLAFLPISNLVDLNATVAEHWLYLPSVGFFIFLAGCIVDLPSRFRRLNAVLACVALAGFGVRSFIRSSDWVDPETFYQRTAAAGGTSGRVAVNLGQLYVARGEFGKAEKIYRGLLKLQPDYTMARNNLADLVARQGKESEARTILAAAAGAARESRKDYPRTWIVSLNLAHMLSGQQDRTAALATLAQARRDYPGTWELISYESELLRETNQLEDALALIRPYAEENRWHYQSWMALGRVLAEKGELVDAESALHHAVWLDVRSTEALNLIALMRVRENRFEDARRMQQRAISRQPDQPRQYVLLSNILDKMGRRDEARAALAEVSRLRRVADSDKAAN